MGLRTWKAKYYPCDAEQAAGSWEEAIDHSIRKWKGLNRFTLFLHGLEQFGAAIVRKGECMETDAQRCALCRRAARSTGFVNCDRCILAKLRKDPHERCSDEYLIWVNTGNTLPMLRLLRKAKKYLSLSGGRIDV